MEIEIIEKREQPLLQRTEITYKAAHPNEKTPGRETVRAELAKLLKSKKENIVIDHQEPQFGKSETIGYAKIYKTSEILKEIERKHILIRNKFIEDKGKKKGEAKPKKEAAKPKEERAKEPSEPPKDDKPKDDKPKEPAPEDNSNKEEKGE